MKGIMRKMPGGFLVAADDSTQDGLRRIKNGALVTVEVKKGRNVRLTRKFFSMIDLAFDCQEVYEDRDTFRKAVQLRANVTDLVMLPGGELVAIPRSLSFASMDDIEFAKVYDACLTTLCREFLTGQTPEELAQNVDLLLTEFG